MRRIIAVMVAATALTLTQACTGTAPATSPAPAPSGTTVSAEPSVPTSVPPSATPTVAPSPSRTATSAGGVDVLSGKHQVYIVPVADGMHMPLTVLGVDAKGRVNVTDEFGDRAGFVPVQTAPKSAKYLIKTADIRSGGEALCLQVQGNGSNPLTLVTKACDAGNKDQIFRFQAQGKDKGGLNKYLISVDGVYLHYTKGSRYGLIVQESGEGDDLTSFTVSSNRRDAELPEPG